MQICRYSSTAGGGRVGVRGEDQLVHDLDLLLPGRFSSLADVFGALGQGGGLRDELARALAGPAAHRAAVPDAHLLAPIDAQEVWAAGVTYRRSAQAREEESKQSGIYDRVYLADRPEIFFKATPHRVVGPGEAVWIRADSAWNVPEPELALVLGPTLEVVGYTVANDVSSRSIEGENPLYLPQAKLYMRACSLGPGIVPAADVAAPTSLPIRMTITRAGQTAFSGETSTASLKRSFAELVECLGRHNVFPNGAFLLTGTGIVPPDDFTLEPGDTVTIEIDQIGTLRNSVEHATP